MVMAGLERPDSGQVVVGGTALTGGRFNLLGSLVGGALGIIAFYAMGLIGFYQFTWAAAGAMFGAGLGAITGITLVWLLRQPTAKHI